MTGVAPLVTACRMSMGQFPRNGQAALFLRQLAHESTPPNSYEEREQYPDAQDPLC
jgi:hypothetical protein